VAFAGTQDLVHIDALLSNVLGIALLVHLEVCFGCEGLMGLRLASVLSQIRPGSGAP
jgi:hypothetical protein